MRYSARFVAHSTLSLLGFALLPRLQAAEAPAVDGGNKAYAATVRTTLTNLSARGHVGPGEDVLIAGFVIRGHQQKNILVRATGPALADYQVTGFLLDPTVELYGAGGLIASNDNWMDEPEKGYVIEAAAKTTGAFALTRGSKDAAIYQNLSEGAYTAVVRGKGDSSGEALIEVFDNSCQCSELLNVSARAFMKEKDGVQIAGFNIRGPDMKKVLIRASGPALAQFGLSNVLANPRIKVYRQADNVEIASNDDWSSDSDKAADIEINQSKAGAFPWTRGSKDAALVLTLPAGLYSAVITDETGAAGVCLVEVYDVD